MITSDGNGDDFSSYDRDSESRRHVSSLSSGPGTGGRRWGRGSEVGLGGDPCSGTDRVSALELGLQSVCFSHRTNSWQAEGGA